VEGFNRGIEISNWSSDIAITGNTVSGNYIGINVVDSGNATLTGNVASNNSYGISLGNCTNSVLSGNTVSAGICGIGLNTCTSNELADNLVSSTIQEGSGSRPVRTACLPAIRPQAITPAKTALGPESGLEANVPTRPSPAIKPKAMDGMESISKEATTTSWRTTTRSVMPPTESTSPPAAATTKSRVIPATRMVKESW